MTEKTDWPVYPELEGDDKLTDEEILCQKYRFLFFGNPIGQSVLSNILLDCHFGRTLNPDNIVMVAEYNVGVSILARCGVFAPGTRDQVIRALGAVIPQKEEER